MMNRKFTHKEVALLCVLALIILGGLYYLLVQVPVTDGLAEAALEQQTIQAEVDVLVVKKQRMNYMEQVIEEKKQQYAGGLPLIAGYDNFVNVMGVLNDTLAEAEEYTLSFSPVEVDGDIVRRPVVMNFRTRSYAVAERMLTRLEQGGYRCQISDMDIIGNEGGLRGNQISVSATITYFETLAGR